MTEIKIIGKFAGFLDFEAASYAASGAKPFLAVPSLQLLQFHPACCRLFEKVGTELQDVCGYLHIVGAGVPLL
ncbi:hypothetical protein [Dawidia soli]|uniref:Uncharacterized protein n=1 Tax=Dawidia soli TaxID=2782352 RepID=A0AAP2DCX8_9BACT|nr:hypothetical protein [Dawidia soli]MBT1688495.1 hypothetical protein [Dawidia soli]